MKVIAGQYNGQEQSPVPTTITTFTQWWRGGGGGSKKTVKTGNFKHTRCDEGADKDD